MSDSAVVSIELGPLSEDEVTRAAALVQELGGLPRERFDEGGTPDELWPYIVIGALVLKPFYDGAVQRWGPRGAEERMTELLQTLRPRRSGRRAVVSEDYGPSFVFDDETAADRAAVQAMMSDDDLYTDEFDGLALYWNQVIGRWRPEQPSAVAAEPLRKRAEPILILTALELEREAVMAYLEAADTAVTPAGTRVQKGHLKGSSSPVSVVLINVGNTRAGVLAERAITFVRPALTLVVGVAGALHPDVHLGDVVVATKVYGYQGGAETPAGFRARPDAWNISARHAEIAREAAREPEWIGRVHFRPIVAGDVVLNSLDGPLITRIREHFDDAVAVEMESAGVWAAAHLNDSHPVLTIRGISDRADGNKHQSDGAGWQPKAARSAAAFAMAVCREFAPS